jgi:hypothetical protein
MSLALYLGDYFKEPIMQGLGEGFLGRLAFVVQQVSLGAFIYLRLGISLRVEECQTFTRLVLGKIKRKWG